MDELFKELLDEYENHTSNAYCEMGTVKDLIDRCRKALGLGPAGLDWSYCCGKKFKTYKAYGKECFTNYEVEGFRPPRKGEQYVSGARPQIYTAPNDLSISFYVVRKKYGFRNK